MKKILLFAFLLFSFAAVSGRVLATAPESLPRNDENTEAKCTGSAYCTACRNCNYCKHCNSGGSCGVCRKSKRYRSGAESNSGNNGAPVDNRGNDSNTGY